MPPLPRITIRSHRCFRDEAELGLRPLTLIYGRNQAGKSTLVRLLPLLGDSLASQQGPLDMASPALRGCTFKELGWLGPGYQATQRFAFSTNDPPDARSSIRLDIADEGRGPFSNRVQAMSGQRVVFDASWEGPTNGYRPGLRSQYVGRLDGGEWSGPLEFPSLLPSELPGAAEAVRDAVSEAMSILKRVQWLQANRSPALRGARLRQTRYCSPDGVGLAADLSAFPQVLERASEWTTAADVALGEVRVGKDTEGTYRFEVRPQQGWEQLPDKLAGEGLRALLPVVVCACWAEERTADGPGLLAIEEPEAQLHPRLQVQLMRRLIKAVTAGVPIVIETHSVYVLRTLQLAVLHEEVSPADVSLFWVERSPDGASKISEVEVGGDASLSRWPPGVFEEEQLLAREIFDLRWAREAGQ